MWTVITVQVDRACSVVSSVENDYAGRNCCHRRRRSKHKWYALIVISDIQATRSRGPRYQSWVPAAAATKQNHHELHYRIIFYLGFMIITTTATNHLSMHQCGHWPISKPRAQTNLTMSDHRKQVVSTYNFIVIVISYYYILLLSIYQSLIHHLGT
jgi:hypothetical protein